MQAQFKKIAGWSFILFVGFALMVLGAQGMVGAALATVVAPQAVIPIPPSGP